MALLTDRTLAASSAITASTLIHIVDVNDFSQNPAGSSYKAELGQLTSLFSGGTFTGGSGNCITDFYVTNIHSCSPLYINPLSEGNIYVGSANTLTVNLTNETIGIGTTSPTSKLHIVGTGTTSSGYSLKVQDSSNRNILSTRNDNFVFAGDSAVSGYLWSYGLGGQFGFSNENGFPNLYLNSSYLNKFYFSNGAGGSNAFAQINTSNGNWLLSSPNTNVYGAVLTDTKLIIQGVDSSPSNYGLKVQNSGGTNNFVVRNDGNVGIGTSTPTEKLDVSGKTKTTNLQMTSGATSGYVLTSLDNNGNSSWEPLSSLSGSSVISVTGVTTSDYTATTSYSYYGVEYSGNTNIEIPDATGLDGFTFRIKDERGTSATYPITITPVTGNIDNNNYIDMQINYMSLTLVARNNNWWII